MERGAAAAAAATSGGGSGNEEAAGPPPPPPPAPQQPPAPSKPPSAARLAAQRAFESVGAAVVAPPAPKMSRAAAAAPAAPKMGRAARRRQAAGRDPAPPRRREGGTDSNGNPRLSAAEIEARIREQAARRAARPPVGCPACAAAFFNPASLRSHLLRCCPDLFVVDAAAGAGAGADANASAPASSSSSSPPTLWPPSGPAPVQADLERSMSAAAALEAAKRRAALEITFLEPVERAEAAGAPRPVWAAEADDDDDEDEGGEDEGGGDGENEASGEDEAGANGQADASRGRRRKRAAEPGQQQQQQEHRHDPRRASVAEARRARIAAAPADIAARLGLPPDRAARLLKGAMRAIPLPADPEGLTPEGFPVVYEDANVLAVAKPAGVRTAPIHRWRGGSMVNRALAHLNRAVVARSGEGVDAATVAAAPAAAAPVHVVHRLDLNTSGVLLFAKAPAAARRLHEQFRRRRARKTYLALVVGVPQEVEFEVDAAIARHPALKEARLALESGAGGGGSAGEDGDGDGGDGDDDDEAPKPARTRFRVLASNPSAELGSAPGVRPARLFNWRASPQQPPVVSADSAPPPPPPPPPLPPRGAALVHCFPLTGRTHQIRVHLAAAGHPIVGDDIYGAVGPWLGRQALHAQVLEVDYPADGDKEEEERRQGQQGGGAGAGATAAATAAPLRLVAPPPPDFVRAMRMLGLEMPAEF